METVTNIERIVPGRRAGHTAVRAGNFILIWGGYDEPVKLNIVHGVHIRTVIKPESANMTTHSMRSASISKVRQ